MRARTEAVESDSTRRGMSCAPHRVPGRELAVPGYAALIGEDGERLVGLRLGRRDLGVGRVQRLGALQQRHRGQRSLTRVPTDQVARAKDEIMRLGTLAAPMHDR